jgi:hypothetical protein
MKDQNIRRRNRGKNTGWRNVLLKKLDNSFLLAQDRSLKAIGGCSKKRPDRIDAAPGTPGVGEIHECDEHQHLWSSSSYKCEEARIRELSLELIEANKGDTIVLVFRTNPDGYTPPVGKKKLTETERFELHASLVNKLRAKYAEILPKLHDAGISHGTFLHRLQRRQRTNRRELRTCLPCE